MSQREKAIAALLSRVGAAYPWRMPPTRRLKLWTDVPHAQRPACFLFEGGMETYEDTALPLPKRSLSVKLFIYGDALDTTVAGASQLNDIMDALDTAFAPDAADRNIGRLTLGGAVHRCAINGKPLKDPGDLDGDAILIVPITLVLP